KSPGSALEIDSNELASNKHAGTQSYRAPILWASGMADFTADLYSVSVILAEFAAGCRMQKLLHCGGDQDIKLAIIGHRYINYEILHSRGCSHQFILFLQRLAHHSGTLGFRSSGEALQYLEEQP